MILKDKKYIVLFLTPALLLVTVFLYFPLLLNTLYSFTNMKYSVVLGSAEFIGIDNYIRMFKDEIVWKALLNTVIVMVGCIAFEIGVAMILAFLIDSIKRGFKFFRTVFFFPVMISGAAIGLMFALAYDYNYGMLNSIVEGLFGMEKQNWITPDNAMYLVLIPIVWQYVGFYFVIFLTGMSQIPDEIYESAQLDGITGFKKSIYITIPLMWDVIATSLALVIAGVLKIFDIVYVVTAGGPMNASQLLPTYMNQFIGTNNAYAATIAVLMIVLGFILTKISDILTSREPITY